MKVKEYRIEKGYTQKDMARLLGINQSTYSLKEKGDRGFSAKEILILEKVLGATIKELFKDLNDKIEKELKK